MKAKKYDTNGQFVSEVDLPAEVFEAEPSEGCIHAVLRAENANRRQGTHKTKGFSEVRGGGKKPWRQKGTGYARQGSTRAPHFRGGGTVFGPLPRDYTIRIPATIRQNGIRSILANKAKGGSVSILSDVELESYSTKAVYQIFKTMGQMPGNTVSYVVKDASQKLLKSALNIPNLNLVHVERLTAPELYHCGHLVISESALNTITEKYKKTTKEVEA